MERAVQPVAAAIAGEHAPGPVRTVCRRREPDDEQLRAPDRRSPAPALPSNRRREIASAAAAPAALATAHEPLALAAQPVMSRGSVGEAIGHHARHDDRATAPRVSHAACDRRLIAAACRARIASRLRQIRCAPRYSIVVLVCSVCAPPPHKASRPARSPARSPTSRHERAAARRRRVTVGGQTAITEVDGRYKITRPAARRRTTSCSSSTSRRSRTPASSSASTARHARSIKSMKIGEAIEVHGTPPPIEIDVDRAQVSHRPARARRRAAHRARRSSRRSAASAARRTTASARRSPARPSLENRYIVDGIDITGLTFGNVGTPVLNEFIEELEVVTGGYNAEYGRATGGIVNIVTRNGTDTFRGSVFGVYQPGFLTAQGADRADQRVVDRRHRRQGVPRELRLRDRRPDHQEASCGGTSASRRRSTRPNYTRITKRETDCRKAGANGCSPDYRRRQRRISIRRPASTSPTSSTARSAAAVDEIDVGAREDQRRADRGSSRPAQPDRAAVGERDARASSACRRTGRKTTGPHHRHRRALDREVRRRQDRDRGGDRVASLDGRQRRDRSDARTPSRAQLLAGRQPRRSSPGSAANRR